MPAVAACALGALAPSAGLAAPSRSHYTVVVTNRSDAVNGRTSSVSALNAHPGRDGISLREALQAADHTRGSRSVFIMFGRRLHGRTIWVRSDLPPIHRSHVIIQGISASGARAQVTISGAHASRRPFALMLVQASDVTIRWLRFAGVNPRSWEAAVIVRPGTERNPGSPRGPRTVANIRIEDDVFDNRGFRFPSFGGASVNGVIVGPYAGNPANRNLRIRGVTITGNRFVNYVGNGDALGVWSDGAGASLSGVTIADNTFVNDEFSIEVSATGSGPRQTGTRIVDNRITGGDEIGIRLDTLNARNARIDGTLIAGNSIRGVRAASAISLGAELQSLGGPGAAPGGDVISNTRIVNDVIGGGRGDNGGIYVSAGDLTGSSPSRVAGLTIQNSTLVDDRRAALLTLIPNEPPATGNQITGVTVRNTILWDPNGIPIPTGWSGSVYLQPPNTVMNSLISDPDWAGDNANISDQPGFVNEASGDYRLSPGSPAIGAGSPLDAPTSDVLGAPRRSPPDIGAYEYGSVPRPMLSVTAQLLGGRGTVTSIPAGIRCGEICSARFNPGASVTLTARPGSNSRFLGWRGGCSSQETRCTLTTGRIRTVTARFGPD